MIPLGDASRHFLRLPVVTILIIAANPLVTCPSGFTVCAITTRIFESPDRHWQQEMG